MNKIVDSVYLSIIADRIGRNKNGAVQRFLYEAEDYYGHLIDDDKVVLFIRYLIHDFKLAA